MLTASRIASFKEERTYYDMSYPADFQKSVLEFVSADKTLVHSRPEIQTMLSQGDRNIGVLLLEWTSHESASQATNLRQQWFTLFSDQIHGALNDIELCTPVKKPALRPQV